MTTWMIVVALVLLWQAINIGALAIVYWFYHPGLPLNWRMFIPLPFVYMRWLERTGGMP